MASREVCHGKILTTFAHGFAEERIAVDVANRVPVTIDEQHRLLQMTVVRRAMHVGDVGIVIEVPGIAGTEPRDTERVDEDAEVCRWPEQRVGRHCGGAMRRTEPAPVLRDQR